MANFNEELWSTYLSDYQEKEKQFLSDLQDGKFFTSEQVGEIGQLSGEAQQRGFAASDRELNRYGAAVSSDQRQYIEKARARMLKAGVASGENLGRRALYENESTLLQGANSIGNQIAGRTLQDEASVHSLERQRRNIGRQGKYNKLGFLSGIIGTGLTIATGGLA